MVLFIYVTHMSITHWCVLWPLTIRCFSVIKFYVTYKTYVSIGKFLSTLGVQRNVFSSLTFMVYFIMNLISKPHHKCERRGTIFHATIVNKNYLFQFRNQINDVNRELKNSIKSSLITCFIWGSRLDVMHIYIFTWEEKLRFR